MARVIAGLLESEETRVELGAAARERAMAAHSAELTAARFRELLEVVAFRRLGRGRLDRPEAAVPAERPAA